MADPDDEDLLVPGHPADELPAGEPSRSAAARQATVGGRLGRPGRPLSRRSPFYLGFAGTLGLLIAYAAAMLVVSVRQELLLVAVALFLAIGLNPAVEWLMKRGLRRGLAVLVVFVAVLAFFAAFTAAVVPPLVDQVASFSRDYPRYLDELQRNPTVQDLDRTLHVVDAAKAQVRDGRLAVGLFGGVLGATKAALGATVSTLTVLVLALYLTSALPRLKRGAYRLVPRSRRERVALIGDEVLLRIGGYVGGAVVVALVAGLASLVTFTLLDLPNPLALAMVVVVTDVVPLVGMTVGGLVGVVVAFLASTPQGLVALLFVLAYQQLESLVVGPRIMRRSVSVPPVLTIVAVLVGGTLLGVVGALLAIPVAAAALLVVEEVLVPRQERA